MMRLTWETPDSLDAPVTHYIVETRVGNNMKLGWCRPVKVEDPKCNTIMMPGLASGITYEFRVCAVNVVGQGRWSPSSEPVRTDWTLLNMPMERALSNPTDEEPEAPIHTVPLGVVKQTHSVSRGLSPRLDDMSYNDDIAVVKTRQAPWTKVPQPEPTGGVYSTAEHVMQLDSAYRCYTKPAQQEGGYEARTVYEDPLLCKVGKDDASLGPGVVNPDGLPYAEPEATVMTEAFHVVADYIFYQHEKLRVRRLMTLPSEEARKHRDPRKPETVDDPAFPQPDDWDDRETALLPNYETGDMEEQPNPNYMGEYKAPQIPNEKRYHHFLPSERFSSNHCALMATFSLNEDNLASNCEPAAVHEGRGSIFQGEEVLVSGGSFAR